MYTDSLMSVGLTWMTPMTCSLLTQAGQLHINDAYLPVCPAYVTVSILNEHANHYAGISFMVKYI